MGGLEGILNRSFDFLKCQKFSTGYKPFGKISEHAQKPLWRFLTRKGLEIGLCFSMLLPYGCAEREKQRQEFIQQFEETEQQIARQQQLVREDPQLTEEQRQEIIQRYAVAKQRIKEAKQKFIGQPKVLYINY